jgi:hypothetical protein
MRSIRMKQMNNRRPQRREGNDYEIFEKAKRDRGCECKHINPKAQAIRVSILTACARQISLLPRLLPVRPDE